MSDLVKTKKWIFPSIVLMFCFATLFALFVSVDIEFQESCASVTNNRVFITGMMSQMFLPIVIFFSGLIGYEINEIIRS